MSFHFSEMLRHWIFWSFDLGVSSTVIIINETIEKWWIRWWIRARKYTTRGTAIRFLISNQFFACRVISQSSVANRGERSLYTIVTEDINQGQQQSNMSLTGELMPLCLGSGNTESICLANLDFCQSTGFTVAECDQYMGFSDAIPSPTVQKEIDRKLNETDLNGSLD